MAGGTKFFAIALIVSAALVGAVIAMLFTPLLKYKEPTELKLSAQSPQRVHTGSIFNPPKPEDAPEHIRDAVIYGYNLLKDTQKYAPQYVGNKLNCTNCHFDAGRELETLSLVGVAATYPKWRKRQDYAVDLVTRTQDCFERSMNGTSPDPYSKEMTAIITYYQWISKGVPIYSDPPWLGLKHLKSDHKADDAAGAAVFATNCAACHGPDGQGTQIAPPLWGDGSFNDGAGMHKFDNFAAFTKHFMPKGAPTLAIPQAIDVASFSLSHPRPHLTKK